MPGIHLTANAINLLNGGDVALRPVLQVMDVRQIKNSQSTQERFRFVLSDGVLATQAMLATQLNEYVTSEQVVKGSIVRLVQYISNTLENRRIIIVLNMEILQSAAEIIGDPVNLATGAEFVAGSGASAAHHQQQQPQQPQTAPNPPQQSRGNEVGGDRDIHIHFHTAALPTIQRGAPSQTPSPAYASRPASNGNDWESSPASNGNL